MEGKIRMKSVSIIIPIFNGERFLPFLFESLEKCNFEENDEVLLVDNASVDETKSLCMEQVNKNKKFKYLFYSEKADSYAARNFAAKNAKGDVLIFTDCDCKPSRSWLDILRESTTDGKFVAGNIQLEILEHTIWECFDSFTHLSQTKRNLKDGNVATACMSVMKNDFFNIVGEFEERFAGGDFEWSNRAIRKGMVLIYEEEALVYHPSRKTFDEILIREKRSAYGAGKHYKNNEKSIILLFIKYCLKVFKIDTNIKLSKKLKGKGISNVEILKFNIGFFKIRIHQLVSVIHGYNGKDPRKLGIK